jgi:hypothetical protein
MKNTLIAIAILGAVLMPCMADANETDTPGVITENVIGCATQDALQSFAAVEGKGSPAWNANVQRQGSACRGFYSTMLVKIVARDDARHMVEVDTTGYVLHVYNNGGYSTEITGRGRERVWVAARVVTPLASDLSPR